MSRLLHLDSSLPVVWRSPTSFQIWVDSPVALVESVDQRHLPVLAALHSGIPVEGVEAIASQLSTLSAATDTPAFHALAAWNARNLLRADTPGLVYRIDRYTQEVTTHEEEPSSSCLCRSVI